MDLFTFGGVQYKMLPHLTELISKLDKKDKHHISSFITKFVTRIKRINQIPHNPTRIYILDLMYPHFIHKINFELGHRYDPLIISYLKNFVHAKIGDTRSKNNQ